MEIGTKINDIGTRNINSTYSRKQIKKKKEKHLVSFIYFSSLLAKIPNFERK